MNAADAAGEPAGFAVLYRERYDRMVRLGYLLTGSTAVAEDLVQDVFVKVYRRWGKVDEPRGAHVFGHGDRAPRGAGFAARQADQHQRLRLLPC